MSCAPSPQYWVTNVPPQSQRCSAVPLHVWFAVFDRGFQFENLTLFAHILQKTQTNSSCSWERVRKVFWLQMLVLKTMGWILNISLGQKPCKINWSYCTIPGILMTGEWAGFTAEGFVCCFGGSWTSSPGTFGGRSAADRDYALQTDGEWTDGNIFNPLAPASL